MTPYRDATAFPGFYRVVVTEGTDPSHYVIGGYSTPQEHYTVLFWQRNPGVSVSFTRLELWEGELYCWQRRTQYDRAIATLKVQIARYEDFLDAEEERKQLGILNKQLIYWDKLLTKLGRNIPAVPT